MVESVEFATFFAKISVDTAVKLINGAAARLLVEAVDVLGDDGAELSLVLPLGQLQMGGVGLRVGAEHLGVVEAEKLLRVGLVKGVAQNHLRGILPLLVVQPPGGAEIRDAGLRRDTRAAEKDDVVGPVNERFQLFYFICHENTSQGVMI